ncbi:hypothetical protein F2Q65_18970 [Thiohalocapsa marina]|uniref:Zinc finger DksA/TraR C4-type domain-containing protein n=2 Tax=Thiohalocapsa marina TaxID=424902 RepID=A0A5M8FGF7_9GAMM|nr:hypothetical protein F2Q65_18970 [Thiohalocapsa marina]
MIESAIAAIRSRGSDGRGRSQCTDCGADIPAERLSLVPNAIRCTVCQEAFEFRAVAKCAH